MLNTARAKELTDETAVRMAELMQLLAKEAESQHRSGAPAPSDSLKRAAGSLMIAAHNMREIQTILNED